MNRLYKYISAVKACTGVLTLALLTSAAQAQQGSSGNTTIFGGAQMTFFGNHNFTTGGGGTQPGVINTIRTSPVGILNFGPDANTVVGADDANYVDGYVRKLGTTPFVFPVGDNGHYGPFAASADGTMGAYFFADPSSAVTSMLPSGDYPVLPAGGPFATSSKGAGVNTVSTVEYWDIDGASATPLTLTWDLTSAIGSLTASDLSTLTIVGWDGTKWVAIPSVVDPTSVLGTASDLSSGSITTSVPVSPDSYTAYTFGSAAPVVSQPAFACAPGLSYVIGNRTVNGELVSDGYVLDMVTGAATLGKSPLISGTTNLFVNAIGYNIVDNFIWGYRSGTDQLVRIGSDWSVEFFPITGLPSTSLSIATGDVSPNGILYLYPSGTSSLYKVDLNPASADYLKAIALPTTASTGIINDWAFSPIDGNIYAFGTDRIMYRFNPTTGERTTLGAVTGAGIEGQTGSFGTAFFDADGNMFVGNNGSGEIFRIAVPHSGNLTATLFSTANVTPGDGARCANAVIAQPPVADDDTVKSYGDPITINILTNDTPGSSPLVPTTVRLIDPQTGNPVTSVTIPGEGIYTVDTETGQITFDPDDSFAGESTVTYQVEDENGLVATATITVTVDPLPVTLVSFSAEKADGRTVLLSWSTTMETNSDRFEIERSGNGRDFDKIGLLSSHKESTELKNYTFVDKAPLSGESLYRLKMVDQDETFAYSRIRSISFDQSIEISAYPNPVSDRLFISNPGQVQEVTLYNASGRKVYQNRLLTEQGIDISNLPAGIYTARFILNDGSLSTHKIAVAR